MGQAGLTFWQRRYLTAYYRDCDDATLALGSGLSTLRVTEYLARVGGTRSAGDLRRIAAAGVKPAPEMFTPETARRAMTRLQTRPLRGIDGLLIAAMFLGSAVLYALTCARTVTGEDAGELLAAAHGFGVPHPPGYPLWLLLSWAADHAVPWVSVAWRVSMVSALASAAANGLFLAVLLKTLRSRLAAVTAAGLFAVSLTHWTQAVIPEVYGLNTCFIALQTLLLVRLAERHTAGRLLALAAVSGLSLANHTSAAPLGAVFALGAALVAPELLRSPRVVIGALAAAILPLALFLVLPLAAARHPYANWGNPETAEALWKHITREQYAGVQAEQQAAGGYDDYLARLAIMTHWATRQFGSGWVLLLAALGVLGLFLRQTGLWLAMLAVGWICSVGVTQFTAFPFEREHLYAVQIFWIPAWLVLAWWIGGGLDLLLDGMQRLHAGARRTAHAVAAAACVALVAWPASAHYATADRSRTTLIADYGRAILDAMDPGALYFPSSDHSTFSVLYQQGVLGYRTDVTIADKYGQLDESLALPLLESGERQLLNALPSGGRRALLESVLIRKWPGPVYCANRRELGDIPQRTLQPVGPIYKVMTADEAKAWWTPGAQRAAPGLQSWDRCAALLEVDDRQRLDFTVQMVLAELLGMRGFALLDAGQLDEAKQVWSRIEADLAPLKQTFNNIGAALAEHGQPELAVAYFAAALAEDPRYLLALRNEALVRRDQGQRPLAITLLRQALEVTPGERVLRLQLAHLLEDDDKLLDALAEYETLAASDGSDPVPWRDAGRLLERGGDLRKAEQAYAESLRLDPGQQDVAERLQRLRLGLTDPGDEAVAQADNDHDPESAALPRLPRLPGDPVVGQRFDSMGHVAGPGRP